VIAMSVHRPVLHLDEQQARDLVRGRVLQWGELDQPGGAVEVSHLKTLPSALSTDQVAVVPAVAVTPMVQVATVAGVDPMTDPAHYPITVPAGQPVPEVTRVTVVGDLMFGRRVGAATPARPDSVLMPMAGRLASADVTVGNLESTLSDNGAPRQGDDSFAADPRVLHALDAAGFDVLSLANNHTGDFGERALRETFARLDASPIARVGAGVNAREAWRPVVLKRHGVSFGFVAFNAIGETPRATAHGPGAAAVRMQPRTGPLSPGDLRRATRTVHRLSRDVDVVVVLPHWGDQYTNQAVPDQRIVGEALLDAGADIVVGGHPHWVQGVDVHDGRLVMNSLGNFVFDMDFMAETQQGVTLDLVCWGGRVVSVRLQPYVIGTDFAPRPVHGTVARTILDRVWQTSDPPFRS
jgi:poly-gamma-glutamate capsule biosynthesis protein CapA/YwtB (metallophosphatase superfamily)